MKELLLFVTIVTFASCSNDDSSVPENNIIDENEIPLEQLKGKIKSETTSNSVTTYYYGKNGYLSKLKFSNDEGYQNSAEFFYDGDKIIGRKLYEGVLLYRDESYTYSGNLIIKYNNERRNNYMIYSYDDEENLIQMERFDEGKMYQREEYKHLNGNVSELVLIREGSVWSTSKFKYDDKLHPLNTAYPSAYLKTILVGNNNMIENNSSPIHLEYNSSGLLIKKIKDGEEIIYQYY